jgi:hypothetical protein
MSYRSSLFLIPALSFVLSVSAIADITLNNGADINMTGSPGSTIIFPDGTIQSTATVAGPAGADGSDGAPGSDGAAGADGADGADGSDAAVPTGHGGTGNTVSGTDSFVGGGYTNIVTDDYGTIGGGRNNQAGDDDADTTDAPYATVGGGYANIAIGDRSTVGGGSSNEATGNDSTVGGGVLNTASGGISTVGGGYLNTASGSSSTVGGGWNNTASGSRSTVAGGRNNTAAGNYSFAAGYSANDGGNANSFVWGGATGARTSFGPDTFNVWSSEIYLNGAIYHASDRNLKEGFTPIDAEDVLSKVLDIPITTWRFKSEDDEVKHIGPVAQDFMASFGYGSSDKHITATDADGVALAAIQGLNLKLEANLEEKQTEIDRLEAELVKHDEQFASLEQRLLAMEASMN